MSVNPLDSQGHEAIRERLAALSARPWRRVQGSDESPDDPRRQSVMSHAGYYIAEIPECIDTDETGKQHAEFIAHAPTDLDTLLREVESLRSQVSTLSEARDAALATRQEALARVLDLGTELSTARADISRLCDEATDASHARRALLEERDALQAELSTARAAVRDAETRANELENRIAGALAP